MNVQTRSTTRRGNIIKCACTSRGSQRSDHVVYEVVRPPSRVVCGGLILVYCKSKAGKINDISSPSLVHDVHTNCQLHLNILMDKANLNKKGFQLLCLKFSCYSDF